MAMAEGRSTEQNAGGPSEEQLESWEGHLPTGAPCGLEAAEGHMGTHLCAHAHACVCVRARALASCVPTEQPSPQHMGPARCPQETTTGPGHTRCRRAAQHRLPPGRGERARKTGSEQGWASSPHPPEHAPSEGRGSRSQHTPGPSLSLHAHVSACVFSRVRVMGDEQGPRLQVTTFARGSGCPPVPQALTWLRAALARADSRPAQFPG